MVKRFLIVVLAFLIPASAAAQDLEGTWDFRVADTTIFRFEIVEDDDGAWEGTWSRPDSFASDGNLFARLKGPVERVDSMAGYEFLGDVELSFADNRPGAVPDIFRFRMVDADNVSMTYVGTELEPYDLVRAGEDDPIGDWDEAAIYRRALPEAAADGDIRVRIAPPAAEEVEEPAALRIIPQDLDLEDSVDETATVPEGDAGPESGSDAGDMPELSVEEEPAPLIGDDFLEGL